MTWASVGKGGQPEFPESGGGGQKSTPVRGLLPTPVRLPHAQGNIISQPNRLPDHRNGYAVPWSDEETAEALRLRVEGLSAAQIGRRIGRNRNQVIGRLWRVGRSST